MKRFILLSILPLLVLALVGYAVFTSRSKEDAHGPHAHGEAHGHTHPPAEEPGQVPTAYPDRIVLTWEEDPATSLSVTWRTDTTVTDAVAQIAIATPAPKFTRRARTIEATTETLDSQRAESQHVSARYHSVTFTGLQPDTLYAYRVGDGQRWSEWFHTRTASREPAPFSFIYFGDAQNGIRSHWSRAVRAAFSEAPKARFMVHAGDLVNHAHRGVEWGQWNQAGGWIQSMLPSVPVPGNHEYDAFETWMERDTFAISATLSGKEMTGTLTEPDGGDEPLVATRKGSPSAASYPAGVWTYNVDEGEYEGTLRVEKGTAGFSGVLVREDGTELPLQNVSAGRDTFSGAFMMEVEKKGPPHLSLHWRPQFTLPRNGPQGMKETVYYLDYQGMRVIGLNSNLRDSLRLRRQTEWLEQTLSGADPRWTVVTFHHPMFSSSEGRDNEVLRERWKPLFDEYGVDLVMQGHDHTYARGRAENLGQGVNTRSPVSGTVYVNSVSGAKMYDLKEDRWGDYEGVDMQRSAENTQLFQVVHVGRDTMKYRAYTVTGQLYDAFDLVAGAEGAAPNQFVSRLPAETPRRTHDNTIPYE